MSSTSIARQNRRMKIRQNMTVLSMQPKLTALSSPELNSSPNENTNSGASHINYDLIGSDSTNLNSVNIDKHETYEKISYAASCDFLNSNVLSQPIGKIFVEGDKGFKEINASEIFQLSHSKISIQSENESELINLAFKFAKYFHSLSNFCHGLLGGMSLLYILILLHLFSDLLVENNTVKYFSFFSKPIHNLFNFLCIICCVSVFDRFDITNTTELCNLIKRLDIKLITLLIYPVCLLLSLSTANVDDKLSTPNQNATVWEVLNFKEEFELFYWKTLSISKCFGVLLSWMIICCDQRFNLLLNHILNILQRRKLPLH